MLKRWCVQIALGDGRTEAARGFTLIELMVTVGIVGILAVVAYAGYHKFVVVVAPDARRTTSSPGSRTGRRRTRPRPAST